MSKARKGRRFSEEHKRKLSEHNSHFWLGKKKEPHPEEIRNKISAGLRASWTPERRKKLSEAQRGERSHRWRGGITNEKHKIRKSLEYKRWREAVYNRDNYTCETCGTRGGKLEADHIKPFALYPESRFDLNNGRTLCLSCHRQSETYGGRIKKLQMNIGE